jgi:hypothetical protein
MIFRQQLPHFRCYHALKAKLTCVVLEILRILNKSALSHFFWLSKGTTVQMVTRESAAIALGEPYKTMLKAQPSWFREAGTRLQTLPPG